MIQSKAKERLVAEIQSLAGKKYAQKLRAIEIADLKRFISAFYAPSSPEDLKAIDFNRLAVVAHSVWQLAAQRTPGAPTVRVFNPDTRKDGWKTTHTIIQIVNDDMPFLVDSITGLLSLRPGVRLHVMHHPVMFVNRGTDGKRQKTLGSSLLQKDEKESGSRESYIYVEIDGLTDPQNLKALEKDILNALQDVRFAVEDWRGMLAKAAETEAELEYAARQTKRKEFDEAQKFMAWLADDNFTFLGYREYFFKGDPSKNIVEQDKASGLGILRNPNRHVMREASGLTSASAEIRDFLSQKRPLLVTKANTRARVHRTVHMDYISVKKYDKKGNPAGEKQFVGLFTSKSYMETSSEVPILRQKIKAVKEKAPFSATGHTGKALTHILETFPRDELFLVNSSQLLETALEILRLLERPRPRAFIREDKYERYVSAIVYVPRENYHSGLRLKIEKILCDAYDGTLSVYYAYLSEDVLARWHFIIRTKPGQVPKVRISDINAKIEEASKPWSEGLREALLDVYDEEQALFLFEHYRDIFSEAYKEAFSPKQAITDIHHFQGFDVSKDVSFEVFREAGDPTYVLRLNIYHPSRLITLSECLPMLENLGVRVVGENSYEMMTKERGWIQAFYLETPHHGSVNIENTEKLVEPLLDRVWSKNVENDYFNALAIHAGLPCQDIVILRAYAKYLRQIGLPFSQALIEDCLFQTPSIPRRLVRLFHILFEPSQTTKEQRRKEADGVVRDIKTKLNNIKSLDQDRIFRAYMNAILATIRTNFFTEDFLACNLPKTILEAETPMPALALKIHSKELESAPRPRPHVEIFVYSPRVEGVHLRGGPVARGGLRWSDRREDFRTEVLGLMKAQQVKNAVIVPVGAKGGFYPKNITQKATREEYLAEGLACYRIFVRSLLSVTDNLKGKKVIPPKNVFRWDENDPYFVVAADKGTATFSDVANEIASSLGFWLGDAFASGGSHGYDHKKMGITAKGASVSIARHLREMGLNLATDEISVIGIGDMSGDVFGNGMLLSKRLKLLAAFDHRHIFFDPDPDPAKSWTERKRLFNKPRSSWADYKPALISKGGGVYSRSAKSIKLNKTFRDFLEVDAKQLTPDEVIHYMLKAKADLLWIGGIGTYIKGTDETHAEVGDRANDDLRVNGNDLQVKVVGEGGNLGATQSGRIEFALKGGRINTDFIDNSAGVDCSDKEVNIKILLAGAMAHDSLKPMARNELLADMTTDVSKIVLRDNYLQTQTISLAEAEAAAKLERHAGLIRLLEKEGRMARDLEKLPSDEQFSKIALQQRGLTRPDLSVLVCYAKLRLKDILLGSKLLNNPILFDELLWGFPKRLHEKFHTELEHHQLRREIIATTLANQVVNRAGLTFVSEIEEETSLSILQIISAFLVARDALNLKPMWNEIDRLDYEIPAKIQLDMHLEVQEFLRRQSKWFLKRLHRPIKISDAVLRYRDGFAAILKNPERVLGHLEQEEFRKKWHGYSDEKVPTALAKKVAAFTAMPQVCDIVNVAITLGRDVEDVGKAYYEVGQILGFSWLRRTAEGMAGEDHWEYLACDAIIDDLADQQRDLTRSILERHKKLSGTDAVKKWTSAHQQTFKRTDYLLSGLKASGAVNVAKLSFAARHIRSILPHSN